MLIELTWLETVIIVGLLVLAFGPERVNEFIDDVRTLGNDARALVRRKL